MRARNALPLDDDITDRILIFLPDFASLHATMLASKAFYTVFKAHPNSITRAIAYNVAGPALPQAMRAIRYQHPESDGDDDGSDPVVPWAEADTISPITQDEIKELTANATVVGPLEDLFSMRHKDRSNKVSKLSSMESWRFRRALYRLMLFSRVFPAGDVEFDEDSTPDETLEARRERKKFLGVFSTSELREIHSVALFLKEVAEWAAVAGDSGGIDHYGDLALAVGPAKILESYTRACTDPIHEEVESFDEIVPPLLQDYISQPLSKIWEERKAKPPTDDALVWKSILDFVHGENDICHQCGSVSGFNLWNETNWDFLRGLGSIAPSRLCSLLKGSLSHNLLEPAFLHDQVFQQPFTYSSLMQEIHDIKSTDYATWDAQDWLCESCINAVIRSHLHLWLLERKKKAGLPIPEDCWYGYNCRTHVHSMHHAKRVNHLCEPTR